MPENLKAREGRKLLPQYEPDQLLQPESQIIGNAMAGQKLIVDESRGSWAATLVDPGLTMQSYSLYAKNVTVIQQLIGNLVLDAEQMSIDQSQHVNITVNADFQNCSISLQGGLNALAQSIRRLGGSDDVALAEELALTAEELDGAIDLIPEDAAPDSPEMEEAVKELKKKGLLNRLESLYTELTDENSELRQKAEKIRKGLETVQKIGKGYNNIAQWLGMPQIPRPLLGEAAKDSSSS
jgi:hypothetical protein